MIYKIIGHFNNENFDKIITKVSSRFKFIYCNDALYVAMKRIDNVDDDRNYLYKIFKPARDFYIDQINEVNLLKEDCTIIEWCRNNFVSLESKKFEKEQQEKLRQTWIAMDNMEKQLQVELSKKNS